MTALPDGRHGQALALAIGALALALAWFGAAAPALDWYAARSDLLAQRQVLASRMEGLAAAAPALQRQLEANAGGAPAASLVLDGATDSIAGAALQQLVQDMAARLGASLSSAEALPAQQAGGYRRIGLRVSVGGSWAVLVRLLAAIGQAAPRMLLDDVQLQAVRSVAAGPAPALHASVTVLAFHAGAAP